MCSESNRSTLKRSWWNRGFVRIHGVNHSVEPTGVCTSKSLQTEVHLYAVQKEQVFNFRKCVKLCLYVNKISDSSVCLRICSKSHVISDWWCQKILSNEYTNVGDTPGLLAIRVAIHKFIRLVNISQPAAPFPPTPPSAHSVRNQPSLAQRIRVPPALNSHKFSQSSRIHRVEVVENMINHAAFTKLKINTVLRERQLLKYNDFS